jgi:3-methylcrotonyl-CoA carboxylase alpha subunit
MNTRLQVEHPVTEMVTGVDLVRLQILVAEGRKIPLAQEEIKQIGHAIEVRIYAENPDADFLPTTGTIKYLGETKLSNVRLDTGYSEGNAISIQFDPMIAKLIVWDEDRTRAIAKMQMALNDYPFLGMVNNVDYLKRVLRHKRFLSGDTLTSFVVTYEKDLAPPEIPDEIKKVAEFAAKFMNQSNNKTSTSLWQELGSEKL